MEYSQYTQHLTKYIIILYIYAKIILMRNVQGRCSLYTCCTDEDTEF